MALAAGDLLFVGWDSDNDDITFVTTVDIAAGEVIYFTDDEWNGSSFNGSEQYMEWTVPAGGVAAGSVITIDMDRGAQQASIDAGGGFDYMRGGYDIAQGNEMFWAFQGTRTGNTAEPTNFIAVIGNEANGNNNQTPNLTGTGLTTSNGALIIDGDEDYMEWTGGGSLPDPVERQDLIDSILDTANWTTADGGGNSNPNGTGFNVTPPNIVCFAAGTLIRTASNGVAPIESLRVGDMVATLVGDHGPIRWIGRRAFAGKTLAARPKLYPVRITAGALGLGLPRRDLLVSRQHRILVQSKIAERMFGRSAVLVAAIRLTELPGIYVDNTADGVEYFHLLFDRHEVIYAEGAPAESMFTGPEALKALGQAAREEILTIFPELADLDYTAEPARSVPPGKLQNQLVARHLKNGKALLQPGANLKIPTPGFEMRV